MMHRSKSIKILPDELNNETRIDKKHMELLCDTTNKLIQNCNKKELKVSDLKWQPHYSTVFKQLKVQLELILNNDSTKSLEHLNKIPYLLNLKNNMFTLFNGFAKFVQENGSLIGTKDHIARKSFFMKVVHFQFLFFEIQAYFPNGVYSPNHVKISKMPAKIWWERKFCDNIFVDLDTFIEKFKEDFPFINQAEIFSFRNSINFTSTNITTTFEFDLFTRLYSPWEKLIEVWRIIYSHPAYLHFSTYGDTKDTLSKYLNEPGTYVFRISCKDLGFWTIGYIKSTKEMGQVKVDKSNLIEALVEGNKKNMYLYPNGECTNPDLSNLNEYRKEIVVNNDDLKLYDCFEDFKECKICRELEKDLQLESCGHQICQTCYKLLRKHDKKLCPFCNQKIVSTTKIVNIKDPSIYVDPSSSTTKISFENHYMHMALQPIPTSMMENKSTPGEIRIHSLYSHMADDGEVPPSVPPRIIPDVYTHSRAEAKKSVINYPAMSHINSTSSTSVKSSDSQRKDVHKFGESSSSIYSEMSLSSTSNHNEDMYCDVKEPETVNHTLPFMKKNQYNSKINPATKEFNFLSNQNEESKNLSAVNLTNKFKEVASVGTDEVYWCPHENDPSENVDDTYMIPRESISSPIQYISVFPTDDTYCNPNEDSDDVPVVSDNNDDEISEDLLSLWSSNDVERALRIAKNDKALAREILIEFGAKR